MEFLLSQVVFPVTKAAVTSTSTTSSKVVGTIILYLCSSLSSAGGVGGGALNVPIFFFIWGFTYKESVIMSLATLMGNYLCQVGINLPQRHPTITTRPMIYWDAVLILLPAELGGANIGVVLSAVFPTSLCLILGMIVLLVAFYSAVHKGLETYEKETLTLQYDRAMTSPLLGGSQDRFQYTNPMHDKENPDNDITRPLLADVDGSDDVFEFANPMHDANEISGKTNESISNNNDKTTENDKMGDDETDVENGKDVGDAKGLTKRKLSKVGSVAAVDLKLTETGEKPPIIVPWVICAGVLGMWALYATLYVSMELTSTCSWEYFLLLTFIYPLLLAQIYYGINYLIEKQKNDIIAPGDIIWADFSVTLPFYALIIGILSALLGIGGGELMGPLMLQLKVLPSVSPATTSLMSLLNTSSSLIHYITLGEVPYAYALWGFTVGCAGGCTGRLLALFVSNNYGRPSVMIFMLCGVLVLSFILYIYDIAKDPFDFVFTSYCT